MNSHFSGRSDCPVVAGDVARARSVLLSVRIKIDSKGHDKVVAYGMALRQVAQLISGTTGVSGADALTARGLTPEELDHVYRDLFSSARRCRTFLHEGSAAFEMADNLATACSVLKNLYRMRFHEEKATGAQQMEAGDLAERFMTVSQALCQLEAGVPPSRPAIEGRRAA